MASPGTKTMDVASHILARIGEDREFRSFADPTFDGAQFAAKVVNTDAAATNPQGRSRAEITMGNIANYMSHVDHAIQEHVTTHQEQLLDSVGDIHELQADCDTLTVAVRNVKRSVRSISQDLAVPFRSIQMRALQLKRVHAASLLLRRVLNVQMSSRKLRLSEPLLGLRALPTIRNGTATSRDLAEVDLRELAKAAEILCEVEDTLALIGAQRIDFVETESPFLRDMGDATRLLASAKLREGMKSLHQADIGGALQVFHNLGQLRERVRESVAAVGDRVADRINSAFAPETLASIGGAAGVVGSDVASKKGKKGGDGADTSAVSSLLTPSKGHLGTSRDAEAAATRQLRRRTREHAEDFANMLLESALQVWTLQRVLAKKKDPKTHEFFLDTILQAELEELQAEGENRDEGGGSQRTLPQRVNLPFATYWKRSVEALAVTLKQNFVGGDDGRDAVSGVLVELYPALRKALLSLVDRLRDSTDSGLSTEKGAARGLGSGGNVHGFGGAGGRAMSMWTEAHFGTGVGGGNGSTEPELGGDGFMEWIANMRAADEAKASFGASAGSKKSFSSTSDIRIGGSAELFRHHRRSGVLDDTLLRTISGAATPSPIVALQQQQQQHLAQEEQHGRSSLSYSSSSSPPTAVVAYNEQAALLETLGPIRDRFLRCSYAVVMRPVDQMFPRVEGYANAIPSKHDVLSLMRVIQGELDRSVHGGEASLAPLILRGVSDAIAELCGRVERMVYTTKAAYLYEESGNSSTGRNRNDASASLGVASGAKWVPTVEQKHNLQLLQLLTKLHENLKRLPSVVFGGGQSGEGNPNAEQQCAEAVKPALRTLESLAKTKLLRPATAAMAKALERALAGIHREHFGEGVDDNFTESKAGAPSGEAAAVKSAALSVSGAMGSTYLADFQEVLRCLSEGHLTEYPRESSIVKKALASLAARLLRSFVSQIALVRPVAQGGRTRLTQDMALFEDALSPLADASELGRSYAELQAFRQALFLESDTDPSTSPMKAMDVSVVRPSTMFHHCFARAPVLLSSPPALSGVNQQQYVEWLVAGTPLPTTLDGTTEGDDTNASKLGSGVNREMEAWHVVQRCLGAYSKRCEVEGSAVGDIYTELLEEGKNTLEKYRMSRE